MAMSEVKEGQRWSTHIEGLAGGTESVPTFTTAICNELVYDPRRLRLVHTLTVAGTRPSFLDVEGA